MGFRSAYYSLQGNGRQSPRAESWNQGDRQPDAGKEPKEPLSSKAGRTSETAGAFQIHSRLPYVEDNPGSSIPDTFTQNQKNTGVGGPAPP